MSFRFQFALKWIALFIFLGACRPSSADIVPMPVSAWGPVATIAQAEQSAAPALWTADNNLRAAWVGLDETGMYQFMRAAANGPFGANAALQLPPAYPQSQMIARAARDHHHLLWLDAPYSTPDAGLRLWSAAITPDMRVERGPVRVSDRQTFRYAIASNSDFSIDVVWSGGLPAEPALYTQYIDSISRPRPPVELVSAADWPALVTSNDGVRHLFWLSTPGREVYRAELNESALQNTVRVTSPVILAPGDRLAGFRAGLDATHTYLFWTVVRSSGQVETWYSAGEHEAAAFGTPARLGISSGDEAPLLETGFNGGPAQIAGQGNRWLRWSSPLAGQFDMLALAAHVEDEELLGIVYFQEGDIAGFQPVVNQARIIAAPTLHTDRNRHLYLGWSQPISNGPADLNLTTTNPAITADD